MTICYFTKAVTFVLPHRAHITTWLQAIIQQEGYTLVHLNIIFCNDTYLYQKNKQYLQQDALTDVITFDYAETPLAVEGDMYISIERIQDNAATQQHAFNHELYTVLIHGVLHLLGYNDKNEAEKIQMRHKEMTYVAALQAQIKS